MLVLLILNIIPLLGNHALYLATCQIEIEDSRTWNATIRVFQDDMEDALVQKSGGRPSLREDDLGKYKPMLDEYLRMHFVLTHSTVDIPYEIVRYQQLNDIIEISIKGAQLWPNSSYSITCTILMELFDSQKNAMTISFKDKRKTLLFTKRQQSHADLNF